MNLHWRTALAASLIAIGTALPAWAGDKIVLSQYGISAISLPFAVALENGYFKQQGLDIDGFISTNGGGTTIRNMMASGMPFSEVGLPAAIGAVREGIGLKIVYAAVNNMGETSWVVRRDSPIVKIPDLRGHKIGYTSPQSATDVAARFVVHRAGLDGKVEFIAAGAQGALETALDAGAVDVIPLSDPVLTQMTVATNKYRVVFRITQQVPEFTNQVGIVTTDYAKAHPEVVREILSARKRAVDFIYAHPDDAAKVYAKVWQSDDAAARNTVAMLVKQRFWSDGAFNMRAMDNMMEGIRLSDEPGAKPVDMHALIDTSYLPGAKR